MTRSRLRTLAARLSAAFPEPAAGGVVEVVLPDNGRGPPPGRHPLSAGVVLVIVPAEEAVGGEADGRPLDRLEPESESGQTLPRNVRAGPIAGPSAGNNATPPRGTVERPE